MSDPDSLNVVLLLHMDGANAGTTFVDSSLWGLTSDTSPFGPTHLQPIFNAKTSTAQKQFGTASYTGDAGGGSLRVINDNIQVGKWLPNHFYPLDGRDFTIEASFFALVNESATTPLFSMSNYSNLAQTFIDITVNQVDGKVSALVKQNDGTTSIFTFTDNQNLCDGVWHQVCLQRTGMDYALYIDGVRKTNTTASLNMGAVVLGDIAIGASAGNAGIYGRDSWIDEVRYTNGVARYSGASYTPAVAAFEDPTAPTCDDDYPSDSLLLHFDDTFDPDTKLLLHFDGANTASSTVDSSSYAHAITNFYGGALLSTAQMKFGTASLLCPFGSPKVVTTPADVPEFDLSTGDDFCLEAWVYLDPAGVATDRAVISVEGTNGVNRPVARLTVNSSGSVSGIGYHDGTTSVFILNGVTVLPDSQWHHIALTRSGTVYTIFANGAVEDTVTNALSLDISTSGNDVDVGGARSSAYMVGWVDEARVSVGNSRYTGAFTPSSSPFADGTATFDDSSSFNHVMTPTTVDLSGPAFIGSSSMAVTGSPTTSVLTTPVDSTLDLQNADTTSFTVEFWYKPSVADLSSDAVLFDLSNNGTRGFFLQVTLDPHFSVSVFDVGGGGQPVGLSNSNAVVAGQWYHLAIVMDAVNDLWTLYVDGAFTISGQASVTAAWTNPFGGNLRIGGSFGSGMTGNIDELRVTKGVARYLAPFILPPIAFPDVVCGIPPPPPGTITVYGKFVPSSDFKAMELDRLGTIRPHIYAPRTSKTVRNRS